MKTLAERFIMHPPRFGMNLRMVSQLQKQVRAARRFVSFTKATKSRTRR